MLSAHANPVAVDALQLAVGAVEQLERGNDVESLPTELEALAEALRAAGRACDSAASRVVPSAQALDRSICSRYQRAAARWPISPPPSYARFAAALASLHEAADAARLAARRCDRARDAVGVLLQPSRRS
jgi:hypothetical protein